MTTLPTFAECAAVPHEKRTALERPIHDWTTAAVDGGWPVHSFRDQLTAAIEEERQERDALAAENERLRRRVESMQHVVNCASIFAGLSDMDEIDGEEEHEAMMRLLEAVDGYRAALAKEPTT